MVSLLPSSSPFHHSKLLKNQPLSPFQHHGRARTTRILNMQTQRRLGVVLNSLGVNSFDSNEEQKQQPRTLFPGGFKRPEIKVPGLILRLSTNDVLKNGKNVDVLDCVDVAVSKWVGIVLLDGGNESGGKLYEAACLLKSVIRDRAYLIVAERVDIAAAVDASGVLLSDQGLPALVARNMMMESKSKSVVLPLVARAVQTANAALSASNSEGADFLIYGVDREKYAEVLLHSVIQSIKVPVFTTISLESEEAPYTQASKLLQSGASGLVISLENLKLFTDDSLRGLFSVVNVMNKSTQTEKLQSINKLDMDLKIHDGKGVAGFIKLEDREKQFIEMEKLILLEAISVIRKAAPVMDEVSLLTDAVSQLDDPFLLVIVGEFNSGKSSVINALLGSRYLKEGVVPTTNEITLLCYSEMDTGAQERCEKHPDGQYICYLPAPILKNMNLVDTPGTNVILQRQQRLTEEFVPRADLLLFVLSADRPLTESEVAFLRYIQQWKKKVVFILNKADLYQNTHELNEAIAFIKDNAQNLLNTENVTLFPVSARSAIDAKLCVNSVVGENYEKLLADDSSWRSSGFYELENFLFSFLDGSTNTGVERMKLKLGTPIGIADRLVSSCESFVKKDYEFACQNLTSISEIVSEVKEYGNKIESESTSWRRQAFSLIDNAKARAVRLVESTLQLSNLDLVASYVFKGEKLGVLPAASTIQNDIVGPALSDAQKLLGEYLTWLQSNNVRERRLYKQIFEKRWPSSVNQHDLVHLRTDKLQGKGEELSIKVLENFSASAAATLFEQEIREVFLGTFGGLGAAGLSASLLTSVLPTTLEDLLALGLCSAGGYISISKFSTRRTDMVEKVKKTADALARELEEAMQKDLMESVTNLEKFVELLSKPYKDAAQQTVDRLSEVQEDLVGVEKNLQRLQFQIQNLHVSEYHSVHQ
ncbi:hypothetical protein IFM89_025113 [Coptis chinensis]|uniref:Uncharacterized protein n=1 Tax=Coptis chinensis TaxID=261450 RepID=A0A835HX75_9MAGN|nr:hypothetical protein IFM89_025113 [Coptis chinensis]